MGCERAWPPTPYCFTRVSSRRVKPGVREWGRWDCGGRELQPRELRGETEYWIYVHIAVWLAGQGLAVQAYGLVNGLGLGTGLSSCQRKGLEAECRSLRVRWTQLVSGHVEQTLAWVGGDRGDVNQ